MLLALVGYVVLPLSYIVIRGFRRPSEEFTQRWARTFGVEVTEANRPLIYTYLLRTKRIRTTGALAGLVPSATYTAISQTGSSLDPLILAVVGYLLGAVVAEAMAIPRPPSAGTPTASLLPRLLNAYLPGYALAALRLVPLISLGLVPVYVVLQEHPYLPLQMGMVGFTLISVASVVVAAAAEWTMRKVLRRPQPAHPKDVVMADDALRSASIHALAGSAIALAVLLVGYQISVLGWLSHSGSVRWITFFVSVSCLGLAWGCWVDLGHPKSWTVRRRALIEGRP
jgi:hypothetical protein